MPAGPAIRYRVDISQIGWYGGAGGRLIQCHPTCGISGTAGVVQATRPASATTGAIDAPSAVLVQAPVNTWQAYNMGAQEPCEEVIVG